MDHQHFDDLAKAVANVFSRRTALAMFGGVSALLVKNHALGRKRGGTVQAEMCLPPGRKCKKSSQCCTQRCKGKKKHRKCKDCSVQSCQPGMDACGDHWCSCPGGACASKLDDAPFCADRYGCIPCASDEACNTVLGIDNAACIDGSGWVCDCALPGFNPTGTACAVPPGLTCTPNGAECGSAAECCSGGPCGEWEAEGIFFCRSATCKALGESCEPALWDTDCCEGLCDWDTNTCAQLDLSAARQAGGEAPRGAAARFKRVH